MAQLDHHGHQMHRQQAQAIAGSLAQCLRNLDAIDEGMAAVHVSMALEILARDHQLDITPSI